MHPPVEVITKMFLALLGGCTLTYFIGYTVLTCLVDSDLTLAFCERFGKSIRRLKGKVVFITGASSGIGEATAIALAKHGVKLVLAARRRDELERVKSACIAAAAGKLSPNDVLVLQMDMLDVEAHQRFFDSAVQHFGKVDILFNNAGRSQRATWEDIDLLIDRQMFDLNVFSVVNLTRIAIRYFNTRGEGHVAITSSLAGIIGVPYSGTYTGTKHSINGYYNSLRSEKADQKLTVSIFCPGPTYTNFLAQSFTGNVGEKYGIDAQPADKRMTSERCGQLCAIGLANKVKEGWMALFPLIPFTYIAVYSPTIFQTVLKIVGPKKLFKARDGKEDVIKEVHVV